MGLAAKQKLVDDFHKDLINAVDREGTAIAQDRLSVREEERIMALFPYESDKITTLTV